MSAFIYRMAAVEVDGDLSSQTLRIRRKGTAESSV
jgi:hypothetical protein